MMRWPRRWWGDDKEDDEEMIRRWPVDDEEMIERWKEGENFEIVEMESQVNLKLDQFHTNLIGMQPIYFVQNSEILNLKKLNHPRWIRQQKEIISN